MTQNVETANGWFGVFTNKTGTRLGILCFGVWLHAANSYLAATTLPNAVQEYGGGALIGWAFTLYLLGSILAASATGMMTRSFDIRNCMAVAAGIYLLGCIICAISPDMIMMLAGRFVQGLGGGFLVALSFVGLNRWFDKKIQPRVMAVVSAVWSLSAFCGPMVGGTFATYGNWRFAFWVFVAQALLFIVLVILFMPADNQEAPNSKSKIPILRLSLIFISILSVAFAGASIDLIVSPLLCLFAVILMMIVFWIDEKIPNDRMFPSKPFALSTPVGAGLWFTLLSSFSTMTVLVYGPIFLVLIHDLTPLVAGYFVALVPIAWGTAAVLVVRNPVPNDRFLIRAGSILVTLSIIGTALFITQGPLWMLGLSILMEGAGFGMMWAFVVRKIMESASDNEQDITSSAIPSLKNIGFAFGAATTGIAANAIGFTDEMTVQIAMNTAPWIFVAFLPFALFANIAAWRLTR